ncbi:MAG: trypsin-like peptidase domain-containing protein, partial [Bacteroidota bacterium]|nr:trypsin-like peptidase domain-containing protein [Bacteroidota bacterium]
MSTKSRQPSETQVFTFVNKACNNSIFLVRLLLVCLFGCLVTVAHGQVSYGGKPLDTGAEIHSGLRTAVDYFIEMPSVNIDSLLEIDALPGNRVGGLRFAHTFFTNLTPENSGETFYTEAGTRIWKVGIRSSGAYSLNVLFSRFLIPDKAEVFLYNSDRSCVLGAFTNKNRPDGGEFSIAPVPGDELTIEYHEPPDATFNGQLCISEVNHDYLGLFRTGTRFNQINLPCLPEVTCNTGLDTLSRSVCLLIINGNTYCTGTLLNNTAGDGKPYLLTASHCLQNNASYGSRVVAFLNYKSPRCDKRIRGSEEFSVSGSVTKAISNEVDFALLELNELPPADYRPYLAGWSTDTTRSDTPFTCIHHPYGEVMKYCIDEDTVKNIDWVGQSDGITSGNHWLVRRWSIGHTWGGSSGSPLFDRNHRLRASLTGGDSGGENGCDTVYTGDFFSRFYRAWDQFPDSTKQLKHWLAPGLSGTSAKVVQVNGMDPYAKNPARRLTNILPSDSLGIVLMDSASYGSLLASSDKSLFQYAEHFTTSDSIIIKGIYLMAAKGIYSTQTPVTVNVYEGGSLPGNVLAEAILNPNYT